MTIAERANLSAIEDSGKGRQRDEYYISALADHENGFREGYIIGATEQKAIDKKNAHKAFVELLAVQYGEDCDESMHQYIDDALKKAMEG